MNYYERHLGDYARDTRHLSMLEHGAYNLLMDRYYATEEGFPADKVYRLAGARGEDELRAVDTVLEEFFTLVDGVWIHRRVEEELERASAKIEAARVNGKRGGRPSKNTEEPNPFSGKPNPFENKTQDKPNPFQNETQQEPNPFILETQDKAHQTPDTNHQVEEQSPQAAPVSREKKIGVATFLAICKERGENAIPDGSGAIAYADRIGIPREFLRLAWRIFKRRYAKKRQEGVRGWRQTFQNCVEGNWYKLWYLDGTGDWKLTTAGQQELRDSEQGA